MAGWRVANRLQLSVYVRGDVRPFVISAAVLSALPSSHQFATVRPSVSPRRRISFRSCLRQVISSPDCARAVCRSTGSLIGKRPAGLDGRRPDRNDVTLDARTVIYPAAAAAAAAAGYSSWKRLLSQLTCRRRLVSVSETERERWQTDGSIRQMRFVRLKR